MISWKRKKMLLPSSVRVCFRRKDLKLYSSCALKIKRGINSILPLWTISCRILRKWSISKKTTWNSLQSNFNPEKHSMKNKMHSNNSAATIAELSRKRLRSTSKKRLSLKIKLKISSRLFGKISKTKKTRFSIHWVDTSNIANKKIKLRNKKRPLSNFNNDTKRQIGTSYSSVNFSTSKMDNCKLHRRWKDCFSKMKETNIWRLHTSKKEIDSNNCKDNSKRPNRKINVKFNAN